MTLARGGLRAWCMAWCRARRARIEDFEMMCIVKFTTSTTTMSSRTSLSIYLHAQHVTRRHDMYMDSCCPHKVSTQRRKLHVAMYAYSMLRSARDAACIHHESCRPRLYMHELPASVARSARLQPKSVARKQSQAIGSRCRRWEHAYLRGVARRVRSLFQ